MAFLQQGIMTERQPTTAPQAPSASESQSSLISQRTRRQLGLFFAGAGFFAISSIITRRSLIRRYKATVPKFYQPSNQANADFNGAMEAFEALNIATVNVLSVGIMLGGGLLYAFDISSLDDMRRQIRSTIGADGPRTDQDAEDEIEQWIASVLNMGSKSENEEKRAKGSGDKEGAATILDMVAKLEESRARGLDTDGVATILDRISKLEEKRRRDEERKS